MDQRQNAMATIKMIYGDDVELISLPFGATYENYIDNAMERFGIPADFKDFLQLSLRSKCVLRKTNFEYVVNKFPNSRLVFTIQVDYAGLLTFSRPEIRQPLKKLDTIPFVSQSEAIVRPNSKNPPIDYLRLRRATVKRSKKAYSNPIRL